MFCLFTMFLVGCATKKHQRLTVVEATLDELQSLVLTGKMSCELIIRAHLERIAAYDKSTGLRAVTLVNPNAIHQAQFIDARLANSHGLGPLFCAPLLMKDNVDTIGMETTGGSIALKGFLPVTDASIVKRLRAAGAIIVAKTNMAEWAFSPRQTVSSSFGRTANAYSLDRVPAGSSGGTASGIAASFGVLGIGTDTGNSVRGPSSHLSLFGLRPTLGLVSRAGIIPLAFDRDTAGPMTRTVRDGARLLAAIAGRDPNDLYTDAIPKDLSFDYVSVLDPNGLSGKRIGILRALVDPEDTHPDVLALFESALQDLKTQGAFIIDPIIISNLDEHLSADNNFCPRFRFDLMTYLKTRGLIRNIDIRQLLLDGAHGVDPRVKGGLEYFSAYPADVSPVDWRPPCPDFEQHGGRQAFRESVLKTMDDANMDAFVYPTWLQPPARLERGNEEYGGDNSQLIAPATGLPAATVPMGWLSDGLPTGLQLIGRPFDDGLLIEISYAYEQATLHRKPPKRFPELGTRSADGTEASAQ